MNLRMVTYNRNKDFKMNITSVGTLHLKGLKSRRVNIYKRFTYKNEYHLPIKSKEIRQYRRLTHWCVYVTGI